MDTKTSNVLVAYLSDLIGQPVAVLCVRYTYRGIVSSVDDKALVLTNAFAVEQSGPASGARAPQEDPIPSDICVSIGSVELALQPAWCWHEVSHRPKGKDVK